MSLTSYALHIINNHKTLQQYAPLFLVTSSSHFLHSLITYYIPHPILAILSFCRRFATLSCLAVLSLQRCWTLSFCRRCATLWRRCATLSFCPRFSTISRRFSTPLFFSLCSPSRSLLFLSRSLSPLLSSSLPPLLYLTLLSLSLSRHNRCFISLSLSLSLSLYLSP